MTTAAEIQQVIIRDKFLPLFSSTDLEESCMVLSAAYQAGVRVFEFTNRSAEAISIFIKLKELALTDLPELKLGIGTIKNTVQAKQYINAGADFLVSPLLLEEIYETANASGLLWIPGCATATEIGRAENFGITMVKTFPAKELGGPSYIKAMKAVFPAMQFLATGGVATTVTDLLNWFAAGVTAVGIGSQLFPPSLLAAKNEKELVNHISGIIQTMHHLH